MTGITGRFWLTILLDLTVILLCCALPLQAASESVWKAGIAKAVITPEQPLWMAGYSGRKSPATTALHDLWIKVLVLEDSRGQRGVLLTSDLAGLSRTIYQNVLKKIQRLPDHRACE